jgi:hypothetical protein
MALNLKTNNKEPINIVYVKSANVWLYSIGRSRRGQAKTFAEIENIAKKENRKINR